MYVLFCRDVELLSGCAADESDERTRPERLRAESRRVGDVQLRRRLLGHSDERVSGVQLDDRPLVCSQRQLHTYELRTTALSLLVLVRHILVLYSVLHFE